MLKGNDLILSLDGVRLAASRSCQVDRQTDTLPTCSPTQGSAKRFIPTTTSWAITAGGLYANTEGAERLRDIWRKYQRGIHDLLTIRYTTADGQIEVGQAILTSLQETGNVNALATFSIQLQGSGELEESIRPLPLHSFSGGVDVIMEWDEDQLLIYGQQQGYEVRTATLPARNATLRIKGKHEWFVFDDSEAGLQSYVTRLDAAIEQAMTGHGISSTESVVQIDDQDLSLAICSNDMDNVVVTIEE